MPALRAHFGLKGKADDLTDDRRTLQRYPPRPAQQHILRADRHHRRQPLLALINGPNASPQVTDTVMANMERWRWLPRDLGDPYVMVNVPDFTLKLVHDASRGLAHQDRRRQAADADPAAHRVDGPALSSIRPGTCRNRSSITSCCRATRAIPNIFDRMGLEVKKGPRRPYQRGAAARRGQRARPHQVQLPQQVPGLPARYAGEAAVLIR